MRVLVADRNALLLEAISRTFAHRFTLCTATTHERCDALLRQGGFDLTVISEKLADGPGLALLGQIARDSPDTRRVFCARRSRLRLLQGKLGPFGLFRTLAYPIVAQDLLTALVLARAAVEIDVPVLDTSEPRTRTVPVARPRPRRPQTAARAVAPRVAPQPAVALFQHAQARREPASAVARGASIVWPAQRSSMRRGSTRSNVWLAATMVGVFLMTLTLNALHGAFDRGSEDASSVEIQQPDSSAPLRGSARARSMPVFRPAPTLARHLDATPVATHVRVKRVVPQVVASTSRIADPSTFGSEAYEPIYPN